MAIASDASLNVGIFGDSGAKLIKKWETTAFLRDKNFGAAQYRQKERGASTTPLSRFHYTIYKCLDNRYMYYCGDENGDEMTKW